MKTAFNKEEMQKCIDSCTNNTPTSKVYCANSFNERFEIDKTQLFTNNTSGQPYLVVKNIYGTGGHGVKFYFHNEISNLKQDAQNIFTQTEIITTPKILVQEYIKPKLKNISSGLHGAAHYRVIMCLDITGEYKYIGGLRLEKKDTFISNTSNKEKTKLFKESLIVDDKFQEHKDNIIKSLAKIAKIMGISQFGADVIIGENNKFYILELNDGHGISGQLLENQAIHEKYAKSFYSRALYNKYFMVDGLPIRAKYHSLFTPNDKAINNVTANAYR